MGQSYTFNWIHLRYTNCHIFLWISSSINTNFHSKTSFWFITYCHLSFPSLECDLFSAKILVWQAKAAIWSKEDWFWYDFINCSSIFIHGDNFVESSYLHVNCIHSWICWVIHSYIQPNYRQNLSLQSEPTMIYWLSETCLWFPLYKPGSIQNKSWFIVHTMNRDLFYMYIHATIIHESSKVRFTSYFNYDPGVAPTWIRLVGKSYNGI